MPTDELKITVSLKQWFYHVQQKGQRFTIFDIAFKSQIISQPNWEKEYYIEEDPETPAIFRLWPLDAWLFNKANNVELKLENNTANLKAAGAYHQAIEQWKLNLRKQLRPKFQPSQIEQFIKYTLDPKVEFVSNKEFLTEEQIRQKENYQFQVRDKILSKFPMPPKPEGVN